MQSAYNTAMGEEREQLPGSWEEPIIRGMEAMKDNDVDTGKSKAEESYNTVTFDLKAVGPTYNCIAGDALIWCKVKCLVTNFTT